jgi:hypothetical protein
MSFAPKEQISELLQILTRGKQDIGLLLGAGCPNGIENGESEPFIPDIEGLTEEVSSILEEDDDISSEFEDLKNQIANPDIEKILNRIRGLKQYVDEDSTIKNFSLEHLELLEQKVTSSIVQLMDKNLPAFQTPYHDLATWIGSIDREKPVQIFTTNYDLLLEQAFESKRVPYFDGFIGSHKPFFDSYAMENDQFPPRWARLWKVHGSINWKLTEEGNTKKVFKSDLNSDADESVVIHPSHLKYQESRKMPYLAMMDKLRNFLSNSSNVLITIGYSFGDQHLNDVIAQGLQGASSSAVYGLLYENLENYTEAKSLALEIGNLSLIAEEKAILGTNEASWLKSDSEPTNEFPDEILSWEEEAEDDFSPIVKLGDFRGFGTLLKQITGSPEAENRVDRDD